MFWVNFFQFASKSLINPRKKGAQRLFFECHFRVVGFLRGGVFKGGGNWGTLRIPFGKIGEP